MNGQKEGGLLRIFFLGTVLSTGLVMLAVGAVFWNYSRGLPRIITVADYRPLTVTRILGSNGKEDAVMGEYFRERRYVVPYEKIPDVVVKAFISAEDDTFFTHPGINILSIIRAGIANFRAGHVVQGGSTITQQVAKSLIYGNLRSAQATERTFDRKIKELILSTRIERNLTKQNILYLYLNQIYLGHGAYGVQSATRTYFRKDVNNISLAEAALLAGMPQAPGKYSPLLNPKKAKERQLYVLKRMYENKFITQSQMVEAAATPLRIYHDEDINTQYSPYLMESIRRYLVQKYGEQAIYEEGLTVQIPTSPELARAAAKSLHDGLLAVDKRVGYRGALQHLNSTEEIEAFLRDYRAKMIERKVHCQMFLPDGRMDPIEAMHQFGIPDDSGLLELGQIYQAVVTGFDNKRKVARVMIGAVKAELPIENMKWARPARDEKNPTMPRPEPSLPSKIFTRGDVIQVRLATPAEEPKRPADNRRDSGKEIFVALEQDPQVQGALFSIEAQTGYVLAMEGGYDYEKSEFNRAMQAMRQPGSSFKPVIFSSALEKGFTPASIIVDSPIVYEGGDGAAKWKPGNFEEKFYGDTTFRQALIKSRNIPTIKIVQAVQIPYLIEYAKRLGMNAQFPHDLSISLGSGTISPMELTRIYALFPRLGRRVNPIFISKVLDRDGRVLEEQKPQLLPPEIKIPSFPAPGASPAAVAAQEPPKTGEHPKSPVAFPSYPPADDPDQVLDPRVAYVMTHLMKEVVAYGTGHGAKQLGRAAAGKTGTTSDYIDAWFMGFTPHVVTGVWVGFDNQKSIGPGETGARAALPIWLSYMQEAVKGYPDTDFTIPPGVVFASINPNTGKLAPPNASQAIKEAFIEGTEPTQTNDEATDAAPASQGDFFKEDTE